MAQRLPEGAVATGKATLGIATEMYRKIAQHLEQKSRRERPLWVLRPFYDEEQYSD
jgi:hypothetical protein